MRRLASLTGVLHHASFPLSIFTPSSSPSSEWPPGPSPSAPRRLRSRSAERSRAERERERPRGTSRPTRSAGRPAGYGPASDSAPRGSPSTLSRALREHAPGRAAVYGVDESSARADSERWALIPAIANNQILAFYGKPGSKQHGHPRRVLERGSRQAPRGLREALRRPERRRGRRARLLSDIRHLLAGRRDRLPEGLGRPGLHRLRAEKGLARLPRPSDRQVPGRGRHLIASFPGSSIPTSISPWTRVADRIADEGDRRRERRRDQRRRAGDERLHGAEAGIPGQRCSSSTSSRPR